jgi:hypothetical protein
VFETEVGAQDTGRVVSVSLFLGEGDLVLLEFESECGRAFLILGVLYSIYHPFLLMLDEQNRPLDLSSVAAIHLLYSVARISVGERVIDFSSATTLTV